MRLEDATERSESNIHVETHGRASHKVVRLINIIPKADTTIYPPLWVLIWKNLCGLITLQKKEGFTMPEELLNKYRLTSMEEPTDEMLAQIMHEVTVEAKESTEKARKEYFEKLRQSIRESK